MKKFPSVLLAALLMTALCVCALADVPAPGSLTASYQSVKGNSSFTIESYPEIWITPFFDEHIITGIDKEKYPADFLCFASPEGAAMFEFRSDRASLINHDTLMGYYYFAYDRASFELFLEKADAEHILQHGADGLAMYVSPDSRRAYALIDLKPQFGGTAKLEIMLSDYSRDITPEQLGEMIRAEARRVQDGMRLEQLDHYWSEGVYQSVELRADNDPVSAIVDTQALIVTNLSQNGVVSKTPDGRDAKSQEIKIETYSYPHNKEDAVDAALGDGTPYKRYNTDYTGYASFTLLEEGKYGTLYLTIKIDCAPDAFDELLEQAYARVSIQQ